MKKTNLASNEAYQATDASTGLTHAGPHHQPASDDASASPPSQAAPLQAAQAVMVDICGIAACDDLWPETRAIARKRFSTNWRALLCVW